jgi:hypothetical protein
VQNFAQANRISIKKDNGLTTINRVMTIVKNYSKNGGSGCGDNSDDLERNMYWVKSKHGCCSDHGQVFTASALLNGIYAREVHEGGQHKFNEFFDDSLQKWIWVDSQYCLMAKNENDKFLSLYELRKLMLQNQKISWFFFGTSQHVCYKTSPDSIDLFKKESFVQIRMTLDNNVFKVDKYNSWLSWMPREVRQMILLTVGIQPQYLVYDPSNLSTDKHTYLKYSFYLIIFLLFIINLLLLKIIAKLERKFFHETNHTRYQIG